MSENTKGTKKKSNRSTRKIDKPEDKDNTEDQPNKSKGKNIKEKKLKKAALELKEVAIDVGNDKNNINNSTKEEPLKCPCARTVRVSKCFYYFQCLISMISLCIPAIFTFFDDQENIYSVISSVGGILIFIHTIINLIVVLDNLNPPEKRGCRYLLVWLGYEVIKILLVVIQLALADGFTLVNIVLVFMIIEAINFFRTENQVLKRIVRVLGKNATKILIVYLTKFLFIVLFAYLGYFLFKDAIHREVQHNEWIEGNEFDNFQQAVITLLDMNDWFNSYLVRGLENQMPGCTYYYFCVYICITRYIMDNLLLVFIVQFFTDQDTHKLALAIQQKIHKLSL